MRPFHLTLGLGLFFALALVSSSGFAQAPPAHEHGAAQLYIVIDQKDVELSLDGPLINFIPFERAPNSPQETEEVKKMGQILNEAAEIFVLTPAAGCQAKGVRLTSEVLDASLLPPPRWPADHANDPGQEDDDDDHADHEADADHDHADHDHADHDHGEHGDLLADYIFECQKPAALKDIEVRLFAKFPSLTRIDAEVVGESGQKALTLDAKNALVKW
ncbi:MAG: DUF2796 domain-containing protein [Deltaproteobacteria bacterium]|nr:DUF2796 domain-containing protein [Deltaproteobacteria bacterium]